MNSALLGGVALMLTFGDVLLTPMPGQTWQRGRLRTACRHGPEQGEDMSKMGRAWLPWLVTCT